MRESTQNLWTQFGVEGNRIAISTNGFVKSNGDAVMGRGCALEAQKKFPGVARLLGNYIRDNGNVPGYLFVDTTNNPKNDRLMILPVKQVWWQAADPELVRDSIRFLCYEAGHWPDWTFHIPRLGCGNGRLDWRLVRSWMGAVPDNVIVHSWR